MFGHRLSSAKANCLRNGAENRAGFLFGGVPPHTTARSGINLWMMLIG